MRPVQCFTYFLKFVYFYLSQSSYIAKNAYLANGTGQKELTEKDFDMLCWCVNKFGATK